jgi:hypothetical protein
LLLVSALERASECGADPKSMPTPANSQPLPFRAFSSTCSRGKGLFQKRMANGECSPIRHSLLTIRPLLGHTLIFSERRIIGFSNCGGIADRRSPRRVRKPRGRQLAEKPRSPPSEPATNSTRAGKLVGPQQGSSRELIRTWQGKNSREQGICREIDWRAPTQPIASRVLPD